MTGQGLELRARALITWGLEGLGVDTLLHTSWCSKWCCLEFKSLGLRLRNNVL